MAVRTSSTPTTNTLDYRVQFVQNGRPVASLRQGQSEVLTITFDMLYIGNGEDPGRYRQETPGNFNVNPGDVAFVDRSVNSKIGFRFGHPGGAQQNVIFALE